jgi:NAD(P)-dependent dehydrogenase (short-subunit alcohol dehydrogenase family)
LELSQVIIMGDMPAALPYAVNPLPFAGKVISITGASRGLGLALSKYLLIRGATVSMCATSEDNLLKAAKEIDSELPDARYWTCVADIANLDSVRSWIEQTVARFGKLDGCANVAGESLRGGMSLHC